MPYIERYNGETQRNNKRMIENEIAEMTEAWSELKLLAQDRSFSSVIPSICIAGVTNNWLVNDNRTSFATIIKMRFSLIM